MINAHKDADGICSSVLYQEAVQKRLHVSCPGEFGDMTGETTRMFDMAPLWNDLYDSLVEKDRQVISSLMCFDHHPLQQNIRYHLVHFGVPTAAGVATRMWDMLERDRVWIACVGTAGDLFEDWRFSFSADQLEFIAKHHPELGTAKWYYPRSKRDADPASYISSLINAEYRVDFFRGVNEGNGFWYPHDSIEGLFQCGDATSFAYSDCGDRLYERKSIIRAATDHAIVGDVSNVIGYKMSDEEKEFSGHVVEGRHIFKIDNFAILVFKSCLDIGSLAAVKLYDRLKLTSVVLNRYPVDGFMHCSIRGPLTRQALSELHRMTGYQGGGHEEAGGVLIPAEKGAMHKFVQAIRRIKVGWSGAHPVITEPRKLHV